jgi:hypothetical protein
MKPIFTIHAGEYLVGSYIEKHLRNCEVWLPSKDSGIDLLVTNIRAGKNVGIQVKFSKDFLVTNMSPLYRKGLRACGWWTLNRDKIKKSKADFWVFVLYSFDIREPQYVIIKPKKLLSLLTGIHGNTKHINMYLWVTKKNKCWETRAVGATEQHLIAEHAYKNSQRDFTKYLGSWKTIESRLKSAAP